MAMFDVRAIGAAFLFAFALLSAFGSFNMHSILSYEINPTAQGDYRQRAKQILRTTPLIDGHNDFPLVLRQQLRNTIYPHDFQSETLTSHTDLRKMKEGLLGGQFWSVYVQCPEDLIPGANLSVPSDQRLVPGLNEPNVRDHNAYPNIRQES
jgi:hypothetical protein